MRELATIRKIDSVNPIPGADAIEVATVGGWKVVIRKDEFRVGELACYIEIDSWIPTDLAPFLSKGNEPREFEGIKGERLRTVKLRGQISQGLLLSRYIVLDKIGEIHTGMDVSELLGITKYEAPVPAQLAGVAKGLFPSFIPKTDQERCQNLTAEIQSYIQDGTLFEVTEKLDGSSMTVFSRNGEVGVCSRNLELKETQDNTFWKIARKSDLLTKLLHSRRGIALQGEIVGEGIQGNPYKLKAQHFYLYDIYDIDAGKYMLPKEREDFCNRNQITHVPIISTEATANTIDFMLKEAEGKSRLCDLVEREGVVYKSCTTDVSFKVISNSFLLKTES